MVGMSVSQFSIDRRFGLVLRFQQFDLKKFKFLAWEDLPVVAINSINQLEQAQQQQFVGVQNPVSVNVTQSITPIVVFEGRLATQGEILFHFPLAYVYLYSPSGWRFSKNRIQEDTDQAKRYLIRFIRGHLMKHPRYQEMVEGKLDYRNLNIDKNIPILNPDGTEIDTSYEEESRTCQNSEMLEDL